MELAAPILGSDEHRPDFARKIAKAFLTWHRSFDSPRRWRRTVSTRAMQNHYLLNPYSLLWKMQIRIGFPQERHAVVCQSLLDEV